MSPMLNKTDMDQFVLTEKKLELHCSQLREADWQELPQPETQWSKASVAQLSPQEISSMTTRDLECVIQAAELPFLQRKCIEKLRYQNRDTLQRLVFLARRCCRNQGY